MTEPLKDATDEETYFEDDIATFGDRVAAARETLGLTQAQLARRLGVKTATIEGWEADRAEPRANRLQMLAGLLNVSIVWLMSGQGGENGGGVPVPGTEDTISTGAAEAVAELRAIRVEQQRLTERLARLEKKLRLQM